MWRMGRRPPLITLAAAILAACGSGHAAAPESASPTVADVGLLPDDLPTPTAPSTPPETSAAPDTTQEPEDSEPSTTARRTTTTDARPTTTDPDRPPLPVGRTARGNRVLMIGDSILASTSDRYNGEMCASLVPLGWAVEIDAETGRDIEFGAEVLDARLSAGFDAAVVFLGNNYPGQPQFFADRMRDMVERLEPRPVVLVTVSEYEPQQAEVNYIVRAMAAEYDDVRVVDWAEATAANDRLTVGDDLHPTDEGRQTLVGMITAALGQAPQGTSWPACLETEFTDDSF